MDFYIVVTKNHQDPLDVFFYSVIATAMLPTTPRDFLWNIIKSAKF